MENAITKLGFSARGWDRILKVAGTVADLEGVEDLAPKHLSEAVQYRTLDRNLGV
jgi:magnesium chelatase family protein